MLVILAPGFPHSARYTPAPPQTITNKVRTARVTISMFAFTNVKRRSSDPLCVVYIDKIQAA